MIYRLSSVWYALILVITPSSVWASEWDFVLTTTSESSVFVDISSVKDLKAVPYQRPFEVRQAWVKYDHTNDKTEKSRFSIRMRRYNCDAETSNLIQLTSYSADGSVMFSHTFKDYETDYSPEVPDSVGYAIFEIVCGRTSSPQE